MSSSILVSIGSGSGLSSVPRLAFTWNNADFHWNLMNKFLWHFRQLILFSLKKMPFDTCLKNGSHFFWFQCVEINVWNPTRGGIIKCNSYDIRNHHNVPTIINIITLEHMVKKDSRFDTDSCISTRWLQMILCEMDARDLAYPVWWWLDCNELYESYCTLFTTGCNH